MSDLLYTLPNGCKFEAYLSDITQVSCDAIVCACDSMAMSDLGLLSKIKEAGGKDLSKEIRKNLKKLPRKCISLDEVLVTKGYGKLCCKHVMYTCTPNERVSIANIIVSCLNKAKDMKLQSIVFPALGSGICGFPYDVCAEQYAEAMLTWSPSRPLSIHFVIIDDRMLSKIKASFQARLSKFHSTSNTYLRRTNSKEKGDNKKSIRREQDLTGVLTSDVDSGAQYASGGLQDVDRSSSGASVGATSDVQTFPDESYEVTGASMSESNDCPICLCPITNAKTLPVCNHTFCQACIDHCFDTNGMSCPICQTIYGEITGNQPPSSMSTQEISSYLPGFDCSQAYKITYSIPGGIQSKDHPNPGQQYYGTNRTAYLPKTNQGTIVLKMLQLAFKRRLVFTVGKSRTTNLDNSVTWNDIHHKTSCIGGPSCFGYPDDNYLDRVTSELAAKGITPKDVASKKVKTKINV
ncbi:E3 ubiquitin-protein ligase DTX3L-like [Argonauta hians]